MSAPSLLQDDIKRCYLTGKWSGEHGEELEKHHILNGVALRTWADDNGLWIWVTPQKHRWLHGTADGIICLKLLKRIAQLTYEREHSHEEWMEKVRKSYL